jgi:hypothetical protein
MMRNIFLVILIFLFTNAQSQEGTIIKGGKWYTITPNKAVVLNEDAQHNFFAEVIEGKDLVFEYLMRADKHSDRTDDDYIEKIIFSVPKNAKSFYYTDTSIKAAFLLGCFCPDRGWHAFGDGFIKGKKINSTTWKVELDVMTKPNPSRNANAITRKFTANFVLAKPSVKKKK